MLKVSNSDSATEDDYYVQFFGENGRDGRSPHGIYNMIGNAPEIVFKDNTYFRFLNQIPWSIKKYSRNDGILFLCIKVFCPL